MTLTSPAPPQRWVDSSRTSPLCGCALAISVTLGITGLIASAALQCRLASLPNILPLVAGVVLIDLIRLLLPRTRFVDRLTAAAYGLLFLIVTCLFAVLTAYAMQRMAFPLRDTLFAQADRALGLDWPAYAHWIDGHLGLQRVLYFAYNTIELQIALPVAVLAFANRMEALRAYLLAFVLALSVTIVISALLPAAGPIAGLSHEHFEILRFTGATPLDHLMKLREAGTYVLLETPGGIATFPSFHATVSILTPLTLRGHPRILSALLVLNAAMLAGTITEGAHYFIDLAAGSAIAVLAHVAAQAVVRR
jgi:membrane-associated phospholipid phosphatase